MVALRKWSVATLSISGILALGLCTFWILHLVAARLGEPHEERVQRMADFNRIGKIVAAHLRTNQSPPPTIEGLPQAGWLSEAQAEFVRTNRVVYTPPPTVRTEETIILKMPQQDGPLVVDLNGFMRSEPR